MGCETEHGSKRMQRVDWQTRERGKLSDCSVRPEGRRVKNKDRRYISLPPVISWAKTPHQRLTGQ